MVMVWIKTFPVQRNHPLYQKIKSEKGMDSNNNYHRGHKKPYRICTRHKSLVIDNWKTPLEDLEELGARWRRDLKLVQLEIDLGRELCLSDVYQEFGSRIDAINDLLPFLLKWEEDTDNCWI
jgi:hypothetical protein